MSSQNEIGYVSYTAGAAIDQFARVKLASDGTISPAAASDGGHWIGIAQQDAASDDLTLVRLRNCPGTFFVRASAAFAVAAKLFPSDGGCVAGGTTGTTVGLVALEAATEAGDIVEAGPGIIETLS